MRAKKSGSPYCNFFKIFISAEWFSGEKKTHPTAIGGGGVGAKQRKGSYSLSSGSDKVS